MLDEFQQQRALRYASVFIFYFIYSVHTTDYVSGAVE